MLYNLRNFNVRHSPVDSRDIRYQTKNVPIKLEVDLREWDSPIEDQGTLGSCVSHAVTSCFELMVKREKPDQFTELSRLFSYYHTRVLEESIETDQGVVYIRNALKAADKYGICNEMLWPYDVDQFNKQPTPACYLDAASRKITQYKTLDSNLDILESLNQNKPVVIGMSVYDSFMNITDKKSEIPMPGEYDFVIGGHSVVIVGYSLPKRQFLIKNSFGKEWGDLGYCWMPFDYYDKYVFEKWSFELPEKNTSILL